MRVSIGALVHAKSCPDEACALRRLLVEAERELEACPESVVLVDDGESSLTAGVIAVAALRDRGAAHVVLEALPDRLAELYELVDEVISPLPPASPAGPPASAKSPRT